MYYDRADVPITIPDLIHDICYAMIGPAFRLVVAQSSDVLLIEVYGKGEKASTLIGEGGQMAESLRHIAMKAGYQQGFRVYLQVEVE